MLSSRLRIALLFGLAAALGCNNGGRSPVQGKVTLPDGSPLKGAAVSFTSEALKLTAIGQTDEAGVYKLMTETPGDGCLPGTYQVTVTQPRSNDSAVGDPPRLFPIRYESAETSGLTHEVKPGPNTIDIPLKAE